MGLIHVCIESDDFYWPLLGASMNIYLKNKISWPVCDKLLLFYFWEREIKRNLNSVVVQVYFLFLALIQNIPFGAEWESMNQFGYLQKFKQRVWNPTG